MAKKDDKKKKGRKPAAITGAGMKVVKEIVQEAAKAGKKTKYKGKLTKTGKENLVIKSLTDPADKAAIKAAKSSANRKEIIKKAQEKELKRGIKGSRKDAGKAKADIRAKNADIDVKNKARDVENSRVKKQADTKSRIKAKRAADGTKTPNYVMERRLPDSAVKEAPKGLKPVTGVNALKKVADDAPKKQVTGKVTKKKQVVNPNTAKKAAALGVAGATAVGVKKALDSKKSKKENQVDSKSINDTAREVSPKKITASPRNANNAKVKQPIQAKQGKANSGSTTKALNSAVSSEKVAKKFPKGVPPKLKSQALEEGRRYIAKQKKSNVPWEKILESVTMLMSSYILSRGISKRYD